MINNKSHKEKIGSGITRRGFLSRASQLGWASMMATFAGSLYGGFKFMVPNVLYEPPTIFKIGTLDEFGMGVDTRLVKERQIWVARNERGLYVLVAICRHLGCTPNCFADQVRFRCPCHGSIYDIFGNVRGGPAPRTLWRAAVSLDPIDKQILVDTGTRQDPDPKGTAEGLFVEEAGREVEPYFITV